VYEQVYAPLESVGKDEGSLVGKTLNLH